MAFSFLTMTTDPEEQKKLKPLMLTNMYLQIPRILIKPTLEEIQNSFSQVIYMFYLRNELHKYKIISFSKQLTGVSDTFVSYIIPF